MTNLLEDKMCLILNRDKNETHQNIKRMKDNQFNTNKTIHVQWEQVFSIWPNPHEPHVWCGLKRGPWVTRSRCSQNIHVSCDNELIIYCTDSKRSAECHWRRPRTQRFVESQPQQTNAADGEVICFATTKSDWVNTAVTPLTFTSEPGNLHSLPVQQQRKGGQVDGFSLDAIDQRRSRICIWSIETLPVENHLSTGRTFAERANITMLRFDIIDHSTLFRGIQDSPFCLWGKR